MDACQMTLKVFVQSLIEVLAQEVRCESCCQQMAMRGTLESNIMTYLHGGSH